MEACSGASPMFKGIGRSLLGTYINGAFESGLQEIEGWLDFDGAHWDLDRLEADLLEPGSQMSIDGRAKLISSLRWRLKDFLEQARRVRTFWSEVADEADPRIQDFLTRATAFSAANPLNQVWEVVDDPLEAEIHAFVHRVSGGGDRDFSREAAGNFVLMLEAVEEYIKQAQMHQSTLEKLAEESQASLSRLPVRRRGPSLPADTG